MSQITSSPGHGGILSPLNTNIALSTPRKKASSKFSSASEIGKHFHPAGKGSDSFLTGPGVVPNTEIGVAIGESSGVGQASLQPFRSFKTYDDPVEKTESQTYAGTLEYPILDRPALANPAISVEQTGIHQSTSERVDGTMKSVPSGTALANATLNTSTTSTTLNGDLTRPILEDGKPEMIRHSMMQYLNFDYTQTQGIYEAPATAKRIPSVCNLPDGWDTVHDRFICYLATHTPLEKGKIPFNEDYKDRYTNAQISTMLFKRFPGLSRTRIHVLCLQTRLNILEFTDNDYFNLPYGVYGEEMWGEGI